jgi:hypothetical protein
MRASAAAGDRPSNEVLSFAKTSVFSKYANSIIIGETPIELAFGLSVALWCGGF